ncbi:hypothetical protein FIV42_00660 [Persicimonas caeni]|uniref:Uncharacterized protein n=1 Tax=Persicimonas caeni TaxID=2292766 RepID=A0A4Y6PNB6_PERCE|nr:hypothetical protein [Persicimonas caeni]QDG49295.1 hypothetical protein FIV42_00660 [Persicimonas caeni]QED30516.1 hypothetical protein FRD00_00655 [Persicimonas caeni]
MIKRDLWLYPIEFAENVSFRFIESGAVYLFVIPAGIYYAYRNEFSAEYPSLFDVIEGNLNGGVLTGNYEFQVATPTLSSDFSDGGIKLVKTSGSVSNFGWAFSYGTFDDTLKDVLGFAGADSNRFTSGTELVGDLARSGCWLEPEISFRKKRGNAKKIQFRNPGHTSRTIQNTRWGSLRVRRVRYGWIPAAHVHEGKVSEPGYAEVARLAQGDEGNLWFDVWEHGLSTYRHSILIHDEGADDLEVASHPFEIVYAGAESAFASDFGETLQERGELADFWTIDLVVERHPTIGNYGVG